MRKAGLDICRVFAIAVVVLVHTVMLFWDFDPAVPTWAVYNYFSLVGHVCIPLFFMLSGALLLSREKLDLKKHLIRTGHFVLLFYVWSLICYGLDARFFHVWTLDGTFLSRVLSGYFHEWFLPALTLCYCAIPLLHGMLYREEKNVRAGILLLSALVVLLSDIPCFPYKPPMINTLLSPWKLSDLRYLLYFLLGWYLNGKKLSGRALALLGAAALAAQLFLCHVNRLYAISVGYAIGIYYGNFTSSAVLTAVFVFCLCQRVETVPPRAAKALKALASCTFGVYLMHPIAIDALRSLHLDFTQYSTVWFLPACYLGILLLPLAATLLLQQIPLLRNLVQ